jgi:3-oxoacyl-[acyl-carrier-protein] synthase II
MENPSIVISGIGILSPLGIGREIFWKNFRAGQSGIRPFQEMEPMEGSIPFGGEVPGFKPKEYLSPLVYRKMGRASRLCLVASMEAIRDAGLLIDDHNRERIGVVVGTGYGNSGLTDEYFLSFMEGGAQGANPLLFADTVPNTPASHISLYHKLHGPLTTFCQNLISAELAIVYACQQLGSGQADWMLVGGVDELSPIAVHAFSVLRGLNPFQDPVMGRGIVLGEGACVLILEKKERAEGRGGQVYGEIKAYSMNSGITQPGRFEPGGKMMKKAVEDILPVGKAGNQGINLVGLSANFSRDLDPLEFQMLDEVFGKDLASMALSPLKYFTGEFAGMGTLRLAALLLAMRDQIIPPTVDPSVLKPGKPWNRAFHPARPGTIRQALLTGFSFGGSNACLLVGKSS